MINCPTWPVGSQTFGKIFGLCPRVNAKIVSEYDQEIPQSQIADNPVAPPGRAPQPSRDTRKHIKQSSQLSLPHQDDCNTRMDIK